MFGGEWIDPSLICNEDVHFYQTEKKIKEFCVGTPESVSEYQNVLLANLDTVNALLVGYERLQKGETNRLEVYSYRHGDEGRKEYVKYIEEKKYRKRK